MKRYLSLLMIALVTVAALAADKPKPAITFEQRVHDFGLVAEDGGPVRVEFEFANTGDAPLVIVSATASCGCTRPSFTTDPVKPGKKGKVRVTYLPKGRPGEFDKTVKVRTNDPKQKNVRLRIRGTVVPADAGKSSK